MLSKKNITRETVDDLMEKDESSELEFKEAKGNFSLRELGGYCCAMANSMGGTIVLGVTDKRPRRVVGTQICRSPTKDEEKLDEMLNADAKVEIAVVSDHPQGRVVVVLVSPRKRGRPVSCDGTFYKRVGQQNRKMDSDEVAEILMETKAHWLDEICISNQTPDAVMSVLDVNSFYRMLEKPRPGDTGLMMQDLANEGMLVPGANNKFSLTRMGVFLLADSIAKLSGELAKKRVRIIHYRKNKADPMIYDEQYDKGHAAGFQGIMRMVTALMGNPYVIEESHGRIIEFVPHDAVRELIANAIIHRDYESEDDVVVEIFSNKVIITNPGESLTDPDHMIDMNETRNRSLLDAMRKFGLSEHRGTGIDKVIGAVEQQHVAPPEFKSEKKFMEVTLYNEKSYDRMDQRLRKIAVYQHCVLRHVNGETTTNETVRRRFNLPAKNRYEVSLLLNELVSDGRIKKNPSNGNSRKHTSYLPYWVV